MHNRLLVTLLLLAACRSPEPRIEMSDVAPPKTVLDVRESGGAAVDASLDSPDSATVEPPAACVDGGPAAWYLVIKTTECGDETILQWVTSDGLSQALVARDASTTPLPPLLYSDHVSYDGLLNGVRWLDDLPCQLPGAHLGALTELAPNGGGRYRVNLTGHDFGGMTCHAALYADLQGEVVVDSYGFLERADLRGTSTTIPQTTNPACGVKTTHSISVMLRRSCSMRW